MDSQHRWALEQIIDLHEGIQRRDARIAELERQLAEAKSEIAKLQSANPMRLVGGGRGKPLNYEEEQDGNN